MNGYSEDSVYLFTVDQFAECHASIMRIQTRERLEMLALMQQAFHGDKKSFPKYLKSLKVWLPKFERTGPRGDAKAFEKALKGNRK